MATSRARPVRSGRKRRPLPNSRAFNLGLKAVVKGMHATGSGKRRGAPSGHHRERLLDPPRGGDLCHGAVARGGRGDTRGRVHGVAGVAVVDASIMPEPPSSLPHIITIMLAEHLSEKLAP